MSIVPTLCAYVALPSSHIKSPGNLLRETNKLESTEQKIHRQLKQFQAMYLAHENGKPFLERSYSVPERDEPPVVLNKGYSSSRDCIEKFSKKASNGMINQTLLKAIKILALYGITLNLEISSEQEKELSTVLKVLIPELCFFSERFIRMLQITQIVICNREDSSSLSRQSSRQTLLLPIQNSETEENITKTIYKAILAQIIQSKPAILDEWNRLRIGEADPQQELEDGKKDLEDFYIALMQNSNYVRVKAKTEKIKSLLIQSFPDQFSSDWFKNRGKEKKRSYKVQFSEDCC